MILDIQLYQCNLTLYGKIIYQNMDFSYYTNKEEFINIRKYHYPQFSIIANTLYVCGDFTDRNNDIIDITFLNYEELNIFKYKLLNTLYHINTYFSPSNNEIPDLTLMGKRDIMKNSIRIW